MTTRESVIAGESLWVVAYRTKCGSEWQRRYERRKTKPASAAEFLRRKHTIFVGRGFSHDIKLARSVRL